MKIGIVQMPMAWTTAENTATIIKTIIETIQSHCDLDSLIFPELSLTGFHRGIKEQCDPKIVQPAIGRIKQACRSHKISAFIGAPLMNGANITNSYLLVSDAGEVTHTWHKIGLTPSEAKFFTPGKRREICQFNHLKVGVFMCREAEDADLIIEDLKSEEPNLMLWPGYISRTAEDKDKDKAKDTETTSQHSYDIGAAKIARTLQSPVIQCNWPEALNANDISGMGGSKIFSATGECVLEMPNDKVCVSTYDLAQLVH